LRTGRAASATWSPRSNNIVRLGVNYKFDINTDLAYD
jgi:hypothetical protein